MITANQYEALLPGHTAPANFTTLEAYVVARIEGAIGRAITRGDYTEQVRVYSDCIAYPKNTPLVSVVNEYDQLTDRSVRLLYVDQETVTVTYTGGYADYQAADVHPCPADLALAIAWGVLAASGNYTGTQSLPDGIASISVGGDYTVTRDTSKRLGVDGVIVPDHLANLADLGGRCAQLVNRYRRLP